MLQQPLSGFGSALVFEECDVQFWGPVLSLMASAVIPGLDGTWPIVVSWSC